MPRRVDQVVGRAGWQELHRDGRQQGQTAKVRDAAAGEVTPVSRRFVEPRGSANRRCMSSDAPKGVPVAMRWLAASVLLLSAAVACADGPADNVADKVRPVPPPGIAVPPADRAELEAGIKELGQEIDALRTTLQGKPALLDLLPDVQIYHNAVRYALTHNEFFNAKEIPVAKALLKQGFDRARLLREGQAPWNTATGLVARGYVSRIDGSVQPYGLVVPASYQPGSPHKYRLDGWFHGRGETLSEVNFIDGRQKSPGEFTPPHAFVLHPYGRYCNANKFAGEVDFFEALDHVKKHYPIDDN